MMDFITEKIAELEIDKERFSMSVTHERVIPIFNRENYFEKLRIEYEMVLGWIKKHCKVDNNVNRLSILMQLAQNENIARRKDNLNSAYFDALLLSDDENRVFMTNDITTLNTYKAGRGYKVSCEFFLEQFFSSKQNEVKRFLVSKNYRGITVSDENLWFIYSKNALMNVWSDFNKCVNYSLSNYNPNPQNIYTVIRFLKKLFLEQDTEHSYRQRITKQLFKAVFSQNNINSVDEVHRIINTISTEFQLMPIHHFQIKKAIIDVLDEMNLTQYIFSEI